MVSDSSIISFSSLYLRKGVQMCYNDLNNKDETLFLKATRPSVLAQSYNPSYLWHWGRRIIWAQEFESSWATKQNPLGYLKTKNQTILQ